MRNLLKLGFNSSVGLSLRERLASSKAKVAQLKDLQQSDTRAPRRLASGSEVAPDVADRIALVNYATWLWHERKRVCAELYPHRGAQFDAFVMGLNAAEDWHYVDRDRRGGWAEKPPAKDRAIRILDLVGVDWRNDLTESGAAHLDPARTHDRDARPTIPRGWPDSSAILRNALVDFQRVDAAIEALTVAHSDDEDERPVPGLQDLLQAQDDVFQTIVKTRAVDLIGLQAKAQALLADGILADLNASQDVALSLAKDLGQGRQSTLHLQPDPALEALAELARLETESTTLFAKGNDGDPTPEQTDSVGRVEDHWSNVVLKTVPTTARGCKALAQAAQDHCKRWGICFEDHGAPALALIARSPLL